MESKNSNQFSIIAIGNPSIDIIGKTKSSEVLSYSLIEGKTNNADNSNIEFLEKFEKAQEASNLKYLPSGSAINTIKVINVRF